MKRILPILFFVALIIVTNFIPTPFIGSRYLYSTANGEFQDFLVPTKGRDLELITRKFEKFKAENPSTTDTVLYRTFSKNYLKFWNWNSYMNGTMWDYPYLKEDTNQN